MLPKRGIYRTSPVARLIFYFLMAILCTGCDATYPANREPTTTAVDGPSATESRFLSALDRQNRPAALALWDTATLEFAQAAGDEVDLLLAIARLKHATVARWGGAAPYDLQMAVVGQDECGDITDTVTGDSAVVKVASKDSQTALTRGSDSYQMVRTGSKWLLSPGENAKDHPEREKAAQDQTAARYLIQLIDKVGKDVQAGKCANTDDVQRRISEGMPSP